LTASLVSYAQTIAYDVQFNTPGDTEGWSFASWTTNGLVVADAVGGSGESVLTSQTPFLTDDLMIYFPDQPIDLPTGATGWDKMTIRIRQIGTDGVTPVAFNTGHTNFAMLGSTSGGSTPWPVLFWDTAGGDVTVDQTTESDGWNVFVFDLSAYNSGSITAKERMDPVTGNSLLGNFELDYLTITAVTPVPEPAVVSAFLGALIFVGALTRRRSLC